MRPVIALLDETHAVQGLRRFTALLVTAMTLLLFMVIATPLAGLWLGQVGGADPSLAALAQQGLWLGLLLPGLRVLQSWYQGAITYSRHTRGVNRSGGGVFVGLWRHLGAGIAWGHVPACMSADCGDRRLLLQTCGVAAQPAGDAGRAVRDASRSPLQSNAPVS